MVTGQYWDRVIAHHFFHSITVFGYDDDQTCNAPDVERENTNSSHVFP